MALKPVIRDVAPIYIAVGVFCVALFALASCKTTTTPRNPLQAIIPPGAVLTTNQPNLPTVRRLSVVLSPPTVPVNMTFDPGRGPVDGIHVYQGFNANSMQLLATLGPANIFTVNLPTNLPSLVEVRTFINWPPPGVVGSVTLDDGTIENFTNTFYESPGAQMIFVPTNCPAIGLFQTPSGMVLAGWNASTNLEIDSSPDIKQWGEITHITQTGPWQLPVDSSAGQRFWRAYSTPL